MEAIFQIIIGVLGALGGLAGIFTALAYYRKIGRKYDVENDSTEIKNLREVINVLSKAKDDLEQKSKSQDTRIGALENALGIKNAEIVVIETENNKRKRAMASQPICEIYEKDCPIIIKYKELNKERHGKE